MADEIERKFLVVGAEWRQQAVNSRVIHQGYLARGDVSVRIRVIDGQEAKLTIKTASRGIVRREFEYDVPLGDAAQLLQLCNGGMIEKVRHEVPAGGDLTWEIDEFSGHNDGLIIAEIELAQAAQTFDKPSWLGPEVTSDQRYYNVALIAHPFADW